MKRRSESEPNREPPELLDGEARCVSDPRETLDSDEVEVARARRASEGRSRQLWVESRES